uniref:SH3-domain GRB2-like endophilin B1b n=1 Tax=Scleropages formosus TaxID=113540 RepID=A0A8C9V1P1_SCLFO
MDFNARRLATDVGTFVSRAVQFTEETLGQAEKTELDAHLESLVARAEKTKIWTDRIAQQTEVLLQPNPTVRIEGFLYEILEKQAPVRMTPHEYLGECMVSSGHDFGPGTSYGSALIKCGNMQKKIGGMKKDFIQSSVISFLSPVKSFVKEDFQIILREHRMLQNKRLDLDAAKSKLKRARMADAESAVGLFTDITMWAAEVVEAEAELRSAQNNFNQQVENTRLLLEGVSNTHSHHLHCLKDFVDAQSAYYARCNQFTVDLQKQLACISSALTSNRSPSSSSSMCSISVSTPLGLTLSPDPAADPTGIDQ